MNLVLPMPAAFSHLKFELNPTDRVRVRDTYYTIDRDLERAYLFQTDDPRRLRVSFGHKEFYDFLLSGQAEIDRLYYSPHKAERRALFGGRKLENFSDENVSQAELYASLIDLFDSHFGEGRYCGKEPLEKVLERLTAEVQASHEGRKKTSGTKTFVTPDVRTFQRKRKKYHECERDVMSLLWLNGGSTPTDTAFEPDLEDIVQRVVYEYQDPRQPSIRDKFDDLQAEIWKVNKEREQAGLPLLLEEVKLEEFTRRIKKLDKFRTLAIRRGGDFARRNCAITNRGFQVFRPGQRLELDEWTTDLVVILTHMGLWKRMTPDQRAKIPRDRVKVTAIIDVATRFICGLRISLTPTTKDAVAVLRMVATDKTDIGKAVGARTPWPPLAFFDLFHDQSRIYMNPAFARRVRSLRCGNMAPPAGDPMARPFIESVFKNFGRKYLHWYHGRTFWNVIQRGDYDAVANAAMLADEFNRDLVRAVVDVYHNTPHENLAGETPWNAFVRLTQAYSVPPLPSDDQLRHMFGTPMTRQLTRDGIEVFGIRYQSELIQQRLLRKGTARVNLLFDRPDIEAISVEIEPRTWVTVPNALGIPKGVSIWEWVEADRTLSRMNAADAAVHTPARLDAINALRESGWAGSARAQIGLDVMTDKQFDKFEESQFRRAKMKLEPLDTAFELAEVKPPSDGLPVTVKGMNDDIDATKVLKQASKAAALMEDKSSSKKRKRADPPREDDLGDADDVKFR